MRVARLAPDPGRLRRALAWLLLLIGVSVAHGWLLGLLAPQPPRAVATAPRSIAMRLVPAPRVEPQPQPQPHPPVEAAVAAPAPALGSAARADRAPAEPTTADAVPAVRAPATPAYATRVPGTTRLHYRLQRGERVGSAELHWLHAEHGYTLTLEGTLQGTPVLSSASRGELDADGVAPLRYADRRRGRELRAANFQRGAGLITFSGPRTEYALRAGAQDRLSWMIQLPAIVEADPALAQPGARITLFVAGTRGDAEDWVFDVIGRDHVELPAGRVDDALHLRREPQRPYDTRIEVWLDPARSHLPVRALLTPVPGGQALELSLTRQQLLP